MRPRIDAGLMARVQALLDARELPGQKAKERPKLQVTAEGDVTDLLIYDEISWFGICAQDVADALDGVTGDLNVRVNSPGGDVFDGIAIYNMLADHDGDVTVTVDGLAASAASVITMAGDTIRMNRGTQLMIHDALTMAYGNAKDFSDLAELLDKISDTIAGIYADRSGVDAADWRTRMRAETWYNGDEAVKAGLATEMAPSRRKSDDGEGDGEGAAAAAATFDLSIFTYAGRAKAPEPPLDTAVGPHDTATTDGTWDASAQQKKLPSPMPVATARKMYAAYDDDRVEDGEVPKDACHLPHHQVSADGAPGAAVMNGVRNALSRLSQTEGLSDAEQATAERHLRAHLKAGGGDTEDTGDLSTWEVVDETGEPDDVEPDADPAAADPTPADPTPDPDPVAPQAAPDDWAAATAHLTTSPDDAWATLTEALT